MVSVGQIGNEFRMSSADGGESESQVRQRNRLERLTIVHSYDHGRDTDHHIDDWEDPKLELYHIQDRYGFLHDRRLPEYEKRSELERRQISVEVSRSLKWAAMLKKQEESKYFGPKAKHREKMINRVYKGVPDSVRGRLWYVILEIDRLKMEHPGIYPKMREFARSLSPDIRQIDLDVNRTYRDNIMFRERYNGRQRALFHVLAAYSVYNTEVGYCQGMSQIAALLLMYLNEEEDCFWAMSQLMAHPKYAMHGFFINGFPKLLRFQAHHDRLLKRYLPKLKKHFLKHGIDSNIYTLKWFFQCFLDRIPFSLTMRVWDLFLLEGERVLVSMAHNILRMHRRYLMKLGMDDIIQHLQVNLAADFGFEDDVVIDRLRELMHALRSDRMDHPGPPQYDELPHKQFGSVTDHLANSSDWLPLEKELGLRSMISDEERHYAHISTQMDTQLRISEEGLDQDASHSRTKINGLNFDHVCKEDEDQDDDDDVVMLDARCGCSAPQRPIDPEAISSPSSVLDCSFDSKRSGDVVRIRVPYATDSDQATAASQTRYQGNKILIMVNHDASSATPNSKAS